MNLFDNGKIENLLMKDGVVSYLGKVFSQQEAVHYYNHLMQTIEWKNDEAFIFGKHFVTKRKVAWYGDANYLYSYSNTTKHALNFTVKLLELKQVAEQLSASRFNSCLLNLYHDGDEGMAWHSDDEKALQQNGTIASLSFGAERKFSFKHKKTGETVSLILESGSLLLMKGSTQTNWLHRLPPTKKIIEPRVNLTFRTMVT